MKNPIFKLFAAVLLAVPFTSAGADKTWDGGGADGFWQNGLNWLDNTAPAAGDRLIFTGATRTTSTNNFPVGTSFSGISIQSAAGPFTLTGNQITLGGNIGNTQTLVPETINLPLTLDATRTVDVVSDGFLTLGGAISGSGGAGLTKAGGGELVLSATNTFDGNLGIDSGTVTISNDANLGAAPAAATPGKIVIDSGALRATANFTLNSSRGIAVGPASGSGAGTLSVNTGATLTYGGVIANQAGGTGGLTKSRFGNLVLSAANSYTGPTVVQNGTLTLDFTQTSSPANNIISSSSSLTMGGANSGLGSASYDALVVNGKAGATSAQTFNDTTVVTGPAIIRANSGAGGAANLNLGALNHLPGGVLALITPALNGGSGNITTTTPNVNGILGGWATIGSGTVFNNITMGTEFASADASGNVVPYAGYRVYQSGEEVKLIATAATNLRINAVSAGDVIVTSGAGETVDVNTINLSETRATSIVIGDGNTLRLGKFGSIFKSDFANNITWALGSGTTGGANGVQDSGALTAGGAPDTAGEIVFYMNNNTSQSQGSLNVEAKVTDNGTGAVSLIKVGPGSMKLRGHNTFSGGLFLLQGRLQFAGSEIGTGNPDAGGAGPIYVFPGAYLFPSGAGSFTTGQQITNKLFIAGLGTQQEPVGAVRFGNGTRVSGDVELIGDSRIGGGNAANATNTGISGRITGNFNFDIGALQTINSFICLFNPANDWTGTTTLNARNTATANGFANGASEVIPHGAGRGNVVMNGNSSTGTITWDLNGFNETINGLLSVGNLAGCVINNNVPDTTSTLTIGDYDQTATFGGTIVDGAGIVAVTKIGGGSQTFTGVNTYTGPTTIDGGALALSGAGALASSEIIAQNGATFDASGTIAPFVSAGNVRIEGGTFVVGSGATINNLTLSNATLRVGVNTTGVNITAAALTIAGTNTIDITSVLGISSYPTQFTILKYTAPITGDLKFALGGVPNASTQGYISNNVANSSIDLYLTDGPKPLDWTAAANNNWDFASVNWLAFGTAATAFLNFDSVRFDDTAASGIVNVVGALAPAAILVTNTTLDYTFQGSGSMGGNGNLTKAGPGKLTLVTEGDINFTGGVTITGGTLQVGTNSAAGNLPAGSLLNDGQLVLNRGGQLNVGSDISGDGSITIAGSGVTTLSGANTFDGAVSVTQGTLRAGSSTALGSAVGATTLAPGATLDINGRSLNSEAITVSGVGGGAGAVINMGGESQNALGSLTLAGDTTFGGTGRWDIRTGAAAAALLTGGNAYNITKIGPNQVSLVAADVDAALGDVNVLEGTFSIETSTTGLGNPAKSLTVAAGATLQLWNLANPLDKIIVLNGNGTTTTVNNGNGISLIAGPITLNGDVIVNSAGTSLDINGAIGGAGSLTKSGAAVLNIAGPVSYTGNTTVRAGTLTLIGEASLATSPVITIASGAIIDTTIRSDGALNIAGAQSLVGSGGVNGLLNTAAGATLSPGGAALGTIGVTNAITLAGTTTIDLDAAHNTNDVVFSDISITYGGTLALNILGGPAANGKTFKVFAAPSFGGSFTTISPATPSSTQTWDTTQVAIDGTIKVAGEPPNNNNPPTLAPVTYANGNLTLAGTGGTPGATFDVIASADIAAPLSSWTVVDTRQFDASGNFNFALNVDTSVPMRFFVLRAR